MWIGGATLVVTNRMPRSQLPSSVLTHGPKTKISRPAAHRRGKMLTGVVARGILVMVGVARTGMTPAARGMTGIPRLGGDVDRRLEVCNDVAAAS